MNNKPYRTSNIINRINVILEAWTKHAPEQKFAGMNLMEFQAAINPALAVRQNLSECRRDIKGKVAQKKTVDTVMRELLRRVVASVIADGNFGINSPLYRAMDYVTLNDRKSGLTRKSSSPQAPAPTAPAAGSEPTAAKA